MRVDPQRIMARLRLEMEEAEERSGGRNRRQLLGGGSPKEETIQVTAPLFSSRLFEYGLAANDKELVLSSGGGGLDIAKRMPLSRPLLYYGQPHSAIWILSNGGIGFEQSARQYRANILPSNIRIIAPFWNRNDLRVGGKIFYREVTGGRVLDRGQSEIRYQYELEVKVHTAVLVTFEKMQPVGTDPLPDENTNTFQLALFSTSNGTFANFIYSNIGWTQGAEAGFNAGDGNNFFALPTSGTGNIMYLEDYGNTGIPGEWMFILGDERIQRCKAGIKGDTCDEACKAGEWGPDCVRCCHCAEGTCHEANGECKKGDCSQCWTGIACQQKQSRCSNKGSKCAQNALQMTDYNKCGEPQYRCECLAGFTGDPYTECSDIDECTRQPSVCHHLAQCSNTPGRFFCQCPEGFQGDGISECVASFLYPFDQSHLLPSNEKDGRVMEWRLKHPLRIFGRDRDTIWLTNNGLILVKGAKNLPSIGDEQHKLDGMDVQGVAPLFVPIDMTSNGRILVEETTDPRILGKAAQLINVQLGASSVEQPRFVATHALLVTYSNVSIGKSTKTKEDSNTFQALLLGGKDRQKRGESATITFVQFLYRDLHWEGEEAEAGIMAPDRDNSILLPGSGTEGIEQLSQLSNARSQGIWLYRIDDLAPSACLRPELQPPYCDTLSPSLSMPSKPVENSIASSQPNTSNTPTTQETEKINVEEEEEHFEGGREQHLPDFSREEQSGEEKQFQLQPSPTILPKKPAIVQIQSREFEMPPDAFEDGFVRTTTKTSTTTTNIPTNIPANKNKWIASQQEKEEEENEGEQHEIVPSLIVPELVNLQKTSTATTFSSLKTTEKASNPPSFIPIEKSPKIVFDGRFQHKIEDESLFNENNNSNNKFPSPPPMQTIWPLEETSLKGKQEEIGNVEGEGSNEENNKKNNQNINKNIKTNKTQTENTKTMLSTSSISEETSTMTTTIISSSIAIEQENDRNNLLFVFNNTKTKPVATTKKVVHTKPTTTEVPKHKPENPDGDDLLMEDWGDRDSGNDSLLEGVTPNKLSIVVPIAIVLVWLVVLLVVAIFLCCRRRQTQERLRTLYGPAYQIRPVYTMRVNKLDEGNGGSYPATEGVSSYEEHLEKAAQRLSAELAYNPNPLWAGPGRYSLYGSYWNLSPDASAAAARRPLPPTNSKQQRSSSSSAMEMISSPRSSQESNSGGQQQQSSVFSGYAQQISGRPYGNNSGEKEQQQQTSGGTTGDLFHRSQRNSTSSGQRFNAARH